MNYTTNYHLPQWVKTDRIMMDDFNKMCQDIDAGLTSSTAKADAAQAAAAALPYVVGTYTGQESPQDIYLGFKPSVVLIFSEQEGNDNDHTIGQFSAAGTFVTSCKFELTETGFRVQNDSSLRYPKTNLPYIKYQYIAFR